MNELKEKVIEEIQNNQKKMDEESIQKLREGIEKEVEKTSFINRLSSPSTIIAAIIGYAAASQLPDEALIEIAVSILSAATAEHIISSVDNNALNENKYREKDVEEAYKDVDRIYSFAKSTLSREKQIEKRMEAAAYRVMMRNKKTRMMIM